MTREWRYALRSLRRSPNFTVAAILTLAIGIGCASAIYSIVHTILLQPLPYPDGDRLVRLTEWMPHPIAGRPPLGRGFTYPEYLDLRRQSKTLVDAIATVPMSQRMVRTPDGAAGLWGAMATVNTFDTLKVQPLLGRTFVAEDAANPDVVLLSYDVWQRHYHGDPQIIGKALEFRTGALLAPIPPRLLTVIGVMPASFEFPSSVFDFLTPIALDPSKRPPQVVTIARLAPGATIDDAGREILAIGESMRQPLKQPLPRPRFEVENLKARVVDAVRPALRVLLAAVFVVLLIVCANVANLMLARGLAMERDIAVRLAIGATRRQVATQIFVECGALALAGGVLGALLASGGVTLVKQLATVEAPGIFRLMFGPAILPRANEISVNWQLVAIAFSISTIACLVFGFLPAIHLSRANHLHAMASRASAHTRSASRLRSALVTAQVVMATMLLIGGALLSHSFLRLTSFNKGYDPSKVLAFNLLFPDQYSSQRKADTIGELLARFRSRPAVDAAGFARHGLLIGEELYIGRWVPPGRTLDEMRNEHLRVRSVSDGFLTAMGVPVLGGRDLAPSDDASAPPVIVINRSAASKYFTGNPVGQVVDWYLGKSVIQTTVAGVVEDVHQREATDALVPEVFVDYRQYMKAEATVAPDSAERTQNEAAIGFLSFAIRTTADPSASIPAVRDVIRAIDPNIGIDAIAPMSALEASAVAKDRFYAVIVAVFAGVSGLLAAIGIYGVLAYSVMQRTREIGVRIAIGAARRQVVLLVLRRGIALTIVGVVIGLIGAAIGTRSLASMLFGIQPLDAWTFAQVAVAFLAVATAASYLPARRAAGVDPVIALRHD